MQAGAGNSGNRNEEDVQSALTAIYWGQRQAGGGDNDTEDEKNVYRVLTAGIWV